MIRGLLAGITFAMALVACGSSTPSPDETSTSLSRAQDPSTACPAPYDTVAPHAGSNVDFLAGDQLRAFELILPPPQFTGPRPLLLAFHGTGQDGAAFIRSARLAEFAARGFIVIAPDANQNGSIWPVWDGMHLPGTAPTPNPDLALADRLVSCTRAHYSVDASRIFTGGHSAGGIFVNHLLRSRSSVYAGGIVASPFFDFTKAQPEDYVDTLDPMTVIVTWGGDNDGLDTSESPTPISGLTFVEQAAMSSQYFKAQPAVGHVQCRGNNLGHSWLPFNDWAIDVLLARPKGTAPTSLSLPPLPATARSVCSTNAFVLPPAVQTTCSAVPRAGCRETCQFFADCALENKTVGTALASELWGMGLAPNDCGSCVSRCDERATTAQDADVLACFIDKQAITACGAGFEGSFPLFDAFAACCNGHPDSNLCVDLCHNLSDSAVASFVPICQLGATRQLDVPPVPSAP